MNDRILKGYVKDFADNYNLESLKQDEVFERFANYCAISKYYPETFSLDDVAVGGGDDIAIDGIAILVNGRLITSTEEVDYFRKAFGRLEVQFIFTQAKTSPNFNGAEIGSFLFGVRTFFNNAGSMPENDDIKRLRALKEHIYDSSIDFVANPTCQLYYVTTGEWKDAEPLTGRISSEISLLKKTNLFSDVEFIPLDAERLKQTYQDLRRKTLKEIEFSQHTILPKIKGVRQAYIGILSCKEYLKLILDNEGELQKSVFYDNVR